MSDPVPPGAASARLSAAERDAAVARLSTAFADDVIQMEEFERRTTLALRAGSAAELAALLADLPAPPAADGRAEPGRRGAGSAVAQVPAVHRIRAVFGNVERAGVQELPSRLEVRAVFGNVELDLGAAHFTADVTEIVVRATFGNVELRLPAGAAVENRGESMLGSFTCRVPTADAPGAGIRVVITGRALLGSVQVTTATGRG